MKCGKCGIELNESNHWQSITNKAVCNRCNDELAKRWITQHPENRFLIQKSYRDKTLMSQIMGKKFNIKRFNFLSYERILYLFENILWENTPDITGWSVKNE